jgi:hypothetical protein
MLFDKIKNAIIDSHYDWYEQNIDSEIREQVRLLRNNGINTYSSSGEGLFIICEVYSDIDVEKAFNLLSGNGYKNFSIHEEYIISEGFRQRNMTIIFEKK